MGGVVSRPGGQGSNVYVLCAEPKEHEHFRPSTRPGVSVTGVTEKLFMCQMFMCLVWPLQSLATISLKPWVALRGFSLRGFWDVRGFPFRGGKKDLRLPLAMAKRV